MKKIIIGIITLVVVVGAYFYFTKNNEPAQNKIANEKNEVATKINNEVKINIQEIAEKVQNGEITEEEANSMMINSITSSQTFENEFEKTKVLMPKIILLSKHSLSCLEKAVSKFAAKTCVTAAELEAKMIGIDDLEYDEYEDDGIGNWSAEEKVSLIAEMNEGIMYMEAMQTCYNTSNDMVEIMQCAEKLNY